MMERQQAIREIVEHEGYSKSGKIVRLHNLGLTPSEISRELGVTYAHAYSVLKQKGATMRTRQRGTTKSDEIRRLNKQGLPASEIAKRVGSTYAHVYGVLNGNINRVRVKDEVVPE